MVSTPEVFVVGLGNWGTALAHHLACKGRKVVAWSVEADVVASINREQRNLRYLSHVQLSPNLAATVDPADGTGADFIVVVTPAAALKDVLPALKPSRSSVVVSAVKGLERTARQTPLQFARALLGPDVQLAVLSGPSFAKDIVLQKPSGLVAASSDEKCAYRVAELFSSDSMRVYTSTDPLGVELGGIVKNVIAVAAGVADALELGESARAGLITRGLAEMMRLATAVGADLRTLYGLSGLGDLAMTATSVASRNHTVGFRLGRGESLQEIVCTLGSVAEGVYTAEIVHDIAQERGIEMPITKAVTMLVRGEVSARDMVKILISRPIKPEIG